MKSILSLILLSVAFSSSAMDTYFNCTNQDGATAQAVESMAQGSGGLIVKEAAQAPRYYQFIEYGDIAGKGVTFYTSATKVVWVGETHMRINEPNRFSWLCEISDKAAVGEF